LWNDRRSPDAEPSAAQRIDSHRRPNIAGLRAVSSALLMRSAGGLLKRAIAAGEIRADVGPEDLVRTLAGMCYTHDQCGWQKRVLRLIDIFMRRRRAKSRTDKNQKSSRSFSSLNASLMSRTESPRASISIAKSSSHCV
jgi:hypothetical protein